MNRIILVLINGHAGVGKDTFVQCCEDYVKTRENSCNIYNVHRSDLPKEALSVMGWDGEKDLETRQLLKDMVNYAEKKGLLNKYLQEEFDYIKRYKSYASDVILFYHVRDPEVIYNLMYEYIKGHAGIYPISVLIKRDGIRNEEPIEWWDDLENADYTMTIQLPNSIEETKPLAEDFINFLLDTEWTVVKGEQNEQKRV